MPAILAAHPAALCLRIETMKIYRKNYFKKAFIISFLLETVLCSILLWAIVSQGHSGYFLGMFLHIPSSFIGVLIGEAIQKYSGLLAVNTSIIVTVILQFFLFLICIQYFLEKRSQKIVNIKKHNQALNSDG